MVEIRSYSIDELEELTGFNQRTISYYIQQGLLPKVGRRGRSTRYPQLFVDRLKFIQRVRELQDSGRLGSVTLPRIARVIWYLIEQYGDTSEFPELDDAEIQRLFEDERISDERVLGESSEGEPVSVSFGKFGPYVRAGAATASIEAQEFSSITLEDALARIKRKHAEKKKRLIKEFEDAETAVTWLREGNSAMLALVDWNMPGMAGLGFLREIRGDSQFDNMAIMVITSDTSLATMEKAFSLGVDEYLMKPITRESVQAKLEMLGFSWES